MRILMFGWEFPPRISGGLGTACHGMTAALAGLGHEIAFVLPHQPEPSAAPFLRLIQADPGDPEPFPEGIVPRPLASPLTPYLTAEQYRDRSLWRRFGPPDQPGPYGPDLIAEVARYAGAAAALARRETFDLIHAHDWMTWPAALAAQRLSGRPLVVHVHSLEYDRSGEGVNREILRIEQGGLARADRIIAVSHRTRRMLIERHGIDPRKIVVVHNAVSRREARESLRVERRAAPRPSRIVLYLGRITFQKGPDYFIEAAARVLQVLPDVTFVMAGVGDMMGKMVERVGELGIGSRVHFTGFLEGEEIERIFSLSDLYVMPSVSEPFGISPLEAMSYDVPVLLSRQSGVAEILKHALKVDFWDVEEMAAKIIAVLKHPVLADELTRKAREELREIRWEKAAALIEAVYREALTGSESPTPQG